MTVLDIKEIRETWTNVEVLGQAQSTACRVVGQLCDAVEGLAAERAAAEARAEKAEDRVEALEEHITTSLPYAYDDGADDEANAEECIDYAKAEIAELRARAEKAEAALDAAWRATSVDVVRGMTTLDDVVSVQRDERDAARARAEKAEQTLREARAALELVVRRVDGWSRGDGTVCGYDVEAAAHEARAVLSAAPTTTEGGAE